MPHAGLTLPLRQLGRHLRDWRMRSSLSLEEAARRLEVGATTLQRAEKGGNSRIKTYFVEKACELYGVPVETKDGMVGLAKQAATGTNWWHSYGDVIPKDFDVYVSLEAFARTVTSFQPQLIPGLLQTTDYDRALVEQIWPDGPREEWDRRVQIKAHRQNVILRKLDPATLNVVIGEAALRHMVGGPATMAKQLRRLIELPALHTNIRLRVLPFSAGFPGGSSMPAFVVLHFDEDAAGEPIEPPVTYLEFAVGGMYLEKEDDVGFYTRKYRLLEQSSLSEADTVSLLMRAAKEYEHRER
ncbi:helix-turn-helix domain-containing protein [Nocardia sp. 2]|uniref:Helix-turn-helix domain-containing protein n=2 Tax=Nocardia acididurans TaxID=2802282 RepID=A0ABS1M4T1_9NOCA|nr:helix-turn-helix transcriptional regulator [Nocardia acididurans]MBL1075336.1 helix-turn-helix domain-containing protein [Nocardia acididurans]